MHRNTQWMYILRKIGTKEAGNSESSNGNVNQTFAGWHYSSIAVAFTSAPLRHAETCNFHSVVTADHQKAPAASLLGPKVGGWQIPGAVRLLSSSVNYKRCLENLLNSLPVPVSQELRTEQFNLPTSQAWIVYFKTLSFSREFLFLSLWAIYWI